MKLLITLISMAFARQPAHAWQHTTVEGHAHRVCPVCDRHEKLDGGAWSPKIAGDAAKHA